MKVEQSNGFTWTAESASALIDAMKKHRASYPPDSVTKLSLCIGDDRFELTYDEFEAILRKAI